MVIENSALLTVSESASSKFKEVLAEQDADEGLIRISLAPGAMGGVEYILGLEESPDENDTLIEAFGIKIVVDSESSPLLQGSNIDYVEGLQRSGFVISNPNFPSTGGCGGGACACGGGGEQQDPGAQAGGCACGGGGACGSGDAGAQHEHPVAEAGGCACGGGGGGCGGGGGHSH